MSTVLSHKLAVVDFSGNVASVTYAGSLRVEQQVTDHGNASVGAARVVTG